MKKSSAGGLLMRWALVLVIVGLGGCGALEKLIKGGQQGQDQSIFSRYSSEICLLTDREHLHQLETNCENIKLFTDPNSDYCQGGDFVVELGFFPHEDKPIVLCQDLYADFSQKEKVRFFVFGDSGVGQNPSEGMQQRKVAQAMLEVCPPAQGAVDEGFVCDFAVVPGDLIYPSGVRTVWDSDLKDKFEDAYGSLGNLAFYLVPGNHDYQGNVVAQLEYSFFSNRWRMPGRYYRIPKLPAWLNIHGIDTTPMVGDATPDTTEEQMMALHKDFCSSKGWRIVFGHHPAMSNGSHGASPEVASFLNRLQEDCPFAIYLAGHDHHQEHIAGEKYDVIIQGSGGAKVRSVEEVPGMRVGLVAGFSIWRQRFARSAHGFAVVEASAEALDVYFYDANRWGHNGVQYTEEVNHKGYVYHCRLKKGQTSCV